MKDKETELISYKEEHKDNKKDENIEKERTSVFRYFKNLKSRHEQKGEKLVDEDTYMKHIKKKQGREEMTME